MAVPAFRKDLLGTLRAELPTQLPAYLKSQRWFGGKAREMASVDVTDAVQVQRPGLDAVILYLDVHYQGGGSDTYALPLVSSPQNSFESTSGPMLTLSLDGGVKTVLLDALKDDRFLSAILDALERGLIFSGTGSGGGSELRSTHTRALSLQETGAAGSLHPRPLTAEQSNSSIAYGERLILKFIRRLEEGVNPDLEMSEFLTDKANYAHTPHLLGALEYRGHNERSMTQGILQAFVPNQGDAWQYTMKSIEEFYGSVAAVEVPPREYASADPEHAPEVMRGFLDSVGLLAKRTAELHIALASDVSNADFAPEPFDEEFQDRFEDSLTELTSRVFEQFRDAMERLPEDARAAGEELSRRQGEITQRFRNALKKPLPGLRTRIHGDFHLGQVLHTGSDFMIIDFEGEPARPLSERRLKRSPLQDVAGMLRSFHYAAYAPLFGATKSTRHEEQKEKLQPWAEAWAGSVSDYYLAEYLKAAGEAKFLPSSRAEIMAMLQIYLLEKAIYELGYELNNRPDWVSIPIEGIRKVLAEFSKEQRRDEKEPS